jgi:hypothetical protein
LDGTDTVDLVNLCSSLKADPCHKRAAFSLLACYLICTAVYAVAHEGARAGAQGRRALGPPVVVATSVFNMHGAMLESG